MKNLFTVFIALSSAMSFGASNRDLLKKLVAEEKHGTIIDVLDVPQIETSVSVEYSFQERPLKPDEIIYFYIPERFAKSSLSQIGFSHRQKGYAPELDGMPGLTSALVYSEDMPGEELRYWAGHSSGSLGAKFAEYRPSPEFDALYEWPRLGHRGIGKKDKSIKLIRPNVLRLQNVGSDVVWLSKAYVEVVPPVASKYQTEIFTPNSDFGDPVTMQKRWYGGGQVVGGTFPNALRLSSRDHRTQPMLPANMKVEKNRLLIALTAGEKFSSIDVMVGDTQPDGIRNKDGGIGSLGNAKLTISIENEKNGTKRLLLEEKNVGPQGVISAADIVPSPRIQDGDILVITNEWKRSTAYIMGLRLGTNP